MGNLTLPQSGKVYLDTDAIIYSVERIEPYATILQPLWISAQKGIFLIVSSELTLMETLVKPLRNADVMLEKAFRTLLTSAREIRLIPINRPVLELGAWLRVATRIKTPDSIHAATALAVQCNLLISNDPVYRRIPELEVTILDDLLAV